MENGEITMEFTYDGLVRYGFGFYNPNHAAALITMIIPVLWGLRRYFKSISAKSFIVCIEIVFYIALVLTYSRTGVGALALSALFFYTLTHFYLKHEPIKKFKRKITKEVFILGGIGLFVAFTALMAGSIERYFKWILAPDKAVTNRFSLWKGAFQMIADNPDGVGTGLSGRIFTDFMQSPNASGEYRTMVNSFLTFVCEQGIVPFFVFATVFIFLVFASMKIISSSVSTFKIKLILITAVAVLFSAFINGSFSTCFDLSVLLDLKNGAVETNNIMQSTLLFVALSAVFLSLYTCMKHREFFKLKKTIILSLIISGISCVVVFVCGIFFREASTPKVKAFTVNDKAFVRIVPTDVTEKSFLIFPDSDIVGQKKLRSFIKEKFENPRMIFPLSQKSTHIPGELLSEIDYLVICGKNASIDYALKNSSSMNLKLIYYLPSAEPLKFIAPIHKVYLSEFDEQGINSAWEKICIPESVDYCY